MPRRDRPQAERNGSLRLSGVIINAVQEADKAAEHERDKNPSPSGAVALKLDADLYYRLCHSETQDPWLPNRASG